MPNSIEPFASYKKNKQIKKLLWGEYLLESKYMVVVRCILTNCLFPVKGHLKGFSAFVGSPCIGWGNNGADYQ